MGLDMSLQGRVFDHKNQEVKDGFKVEGHLLDLGY